MGTKQLRITGTAQIKNRISEFKGREINLVLTDSTVHVGRLLDVTENKIVLKNMRLKRMSFPLQNILELYNDTKA